MSESSPPIMALKINFHRESLVLRLLEAPSSGIASLCGRVLDGTYDKPFILDTGRERCLHFHLDGVQSAMDLDDPDRLTLPYTRKMMAFLLFNCAPQRILLLGLGGGSLAKFCYRHLPLAAIKAVEVNPDVIALRDEFRIPEDDERFRVVCDESTNYVTGLGPRKDVILADACDRAGIAPQLNSNAFFENARRLLAPGGVFVINLCGDNSSCAAYLAKIRHAFGEFVTLPVSGDGNIIAIAVKEDPFDIRWQQLEDRAIELKRQFGLEFPQFVRRISLHLKLRRWWTKQHGAV
jgi:spermidine synthase